MNIGLLFTILVGGFLLTYMMAITYVKSIRLEKKTTDLYVLAIGLFFGGPAMLLTYIFPEVRDEDFLHKRRYLVLGIVYTVIEIVLVILLFVFNVITY